ncbi:MAG: lysoplasmalogenase [Clostridia bacterium]|nr:lysoplasmalogenase [Clostridia bacterium]
MAKSFSLKKLIISINILIVVTIFVLNWFYQKNGFDFTLKCICSSGFAILGFINLGFAVASKRKGVSFFILMTSGLAMAMLGDVIIKYSFVLGATIFALGHILFVIAYCFLEGMRWLDYVIIGILTTGSIAFLLLYPQLTFDNPLFKVVCVVYAIIICCMLGKATGNFIRKRNAITLVIAVGSILFFFSDLMLLLDWFVGIWQWTDHACMGSYYPALCMLAISMLVKTLIDSKEKQK